VVRSVAQIVKEEGPECSLPGCRLSCFSDVQRVGANLDEREVAKDKTQSIQGQEKDLLTSTWLTIAGHLVASNSHCEMSFAARLTNGAIARARNGWCFR
jgi:hypothetical protein